MKVRVYVTHDKKTGSFGVPTFVNKSESLFRFMREAAESKADLDFLKYPADFDLYEIAVYDDDATLFMSHPSRIFVASVLDILADKIPPVSTGST